MTENKYAGMKHTLSVSWHGLALQLDLDGALYWPEERLLIAADLHLEKGTSYASSAGRLLPLAAANAVAAAITRTRFRPELWAWGSSEPAPK